ncbi:hypothetical protein Tco_1002775 [Tanacetum coccineum]|uniref:Uncharacterized protein n=1 Tax=Tanacetum coccineum TaxID=301880 RepID=A0ABQ5F9I8_9ASTR
MRKEVCHRLTVDVILRGLFRDGCFGKWGTNQKDGSALGIVDATPLSIPFGTVLCSSDGDTRGCLDTSCMIVRGTILRLARIPVMEVTVLRDISSGETKRSRYGFYVLLLLITFVERIDPVFKRRPMFVNSVAGIDNA